MKICFSVLIVYLLSFSFLRAQELELKKNYEYELPDGYDCTIMEVVNQQLVITCPQTKSFFYLEDTKDESLQDVSYTIGRGPAEMGRAPFGIGILEEKIVLLDPGLQRVLTYDMKTNELGVNKLDVRNSLLGLYSTYINDTVFLKAWTGLEGKEIGYFYNVNTFEKSKAYKLPEGISVFEASGDVKITNDNILFASMTGGMIYEWKINNTNESLQWEVFNFQPKLREANLNGQRAMISTGSEYKILDIEYNPINSDQFLLLIESTNDGDIFMSNFLYVFDRTQKKIVDKIELEAKANLMEMESGFLYLHYEDEDKLVKYEIRKK